MITIDSLKKYINFPLEDKSKDAVLSEIIKESTNELNDLCNRRLDYCNHEEFFDGTNGITLVLNNYPVCSLDSIYVKNADNYFENIFQEPDNIVNSAILLKEVGIIKLLKNYEFPKGSKNVKINYTAGYFSAPEWISYEQYQFDFIVEYEGRLYKSLTYNNNYHITRAEYWELFPAKPVPQTIKKAVQYIASKQCQQSPEFNQCNYDNPESTNLDEIIHIYRNTNA